MARGRPRRETKFSVVISALRHANGPQAIARRLGGVGCRLDVPLGADLAIVAVFVRPPAA
jgi:hypothetical protein